MFEMSETLTQHSEARNKAVIFDFDGTIADSFEVFVETIAEVLHRKPLTPEELDYLRGSSLAEIQHYFQIKPWQKPGILLRGRHEVANKMDRVHMFEGMDEVLRSISEKDHTIFILSSNSKDSIQTFLDKYHLDPYVSGIYGGISVTGKAGHLRQLLTQENLRAEDAIYVADEVRDIEATQKVGMQCISVAWGYSTLNSLREHTPSAIVSTPTELIDRF